MLEKIVVRKFFAVAWLLVISILFFLPGSALPKHNPFGLVYFDKLVHIGFFAVLIFLWRFFFDDTLKTSFLVFVLAFIYGLSVEAIQHYLIANRSFDWGDLLADMVGAICGVLLWWWYIKKIDPCGNRGRNQN